VRQQRSLLFVMCFGAGDVTVCYRLCTSATPAEAATPPLNTPTFRADGGNPTCCFCLLLLPLC
jgi:hypothetical protein